MEKDELNKILKSMNNTELLILYHACLKALLKKGINPIAERE